MKSGCRHNLFVAGQDSTRYTAAMNQSQFATPVIVEDKKVTPLIRVEFDDDFRDEDWIQQLLFENPRLIPFDDLEPAFGGSVPVAREVESGSGPIDVLYANSDGLLTLVETKLWRNPQARREVVAQLIDYAASLSRMSYDDLAITVAKALGNKGNALVEKVRKGQTSFDEKRFHETISRNLKRGRFLLLIVGDGIQEGVENMAEFLQGQPHLGFTLRLVEMAFFRISKNKAGPIFVQPRIVAKTQEVVRAIVEVHGDSVVVTTPPEPPKTSGERYTITEEQFFGELEKVAAGTVKFVKETLQEAEKHELTVDWKQAGPLLKFVHPETGEFFTFGQFDRYGSFSYLGRLFERCSKLKLPDDIWRNYFDSIVRLIRGASRKRIRTPIEGEREDIVYTESARPLESLMNNKEEWFKAVSQAIERIKEAMSNKSSR